MHLCHPSIILIGTYWYVPTAGLPATLHQTADSSYESIQQQTVKMIREEECDGCVANIIRIDRAGLAYIQVLIGKSVYK